MTEPLEALDAKFQFDEERRSCITSTDVAGILGLSRWATPLSIYQSKIDPQEERAPSIAMWLGNEMEGIVSRLYTGATNNRVRADNRFYRHPVYNWLGAHLDRRVVGDPKLIVELKTRGSMTGWGDDGSDVVPPDVWCQVQTQIFVTGAREAHVATLFSSRAYRTYSILPDPNFETLIVPDLRRFWQDHVLAGVPPEPTGRDVDTAIIHALGGGSSGNLRSATPEQEEVIERLRLAKVAREAAELAEAEAKNRVEVLIGVDYDGIIGSFGTVYWRRTGEIHKTDWRLVAETYRQAVMHLLEMIDADDVNPADVPSMRAQIDMALSLYTKVEQGIRRLLPRFKEDD
jgi:putative phage-type endonuclease